ncbi:hypothetical protein A6P39_005255 [Streptomyces sp. FXJ1.172]|uniref:hypothetical protein n=1 Tax=Streptomyces sp. FXJ1.172 TaxID=710705 RepID=UPI0007CF22E0|nr:hypothetical protein [Streptomyces sp. FXJ1.172]WEO93472.1 hypothetical protein A6P39_005255 [Streptomyces sp. FXJ1.172]
MKVARSTMVTAAVSAAAALAASGLTYAAAVPSSVPQAAPASAFDAPLGGDSGQGKGNEGRGNEGRGNGGRGHEDHEEEGRIQINERSYSSHPGDCITVISGLGAKTLNIRNESHKSVEIFRGAVCDNGAPIATVGPHSSSFGVNAPHVDGIDIEDGVVASFRVIHHHDED